LKDVVKFHGGKLEFVGQMTELQRDRLLKRVETEHDRVAIEEMYENSRHRDVPDWVPEGWRAKVENRFQRRWPAQVWHGVQGRQYHFVSWIFYALVVGFCLGLPYALKKRSKSATADSESEKSNKTPTSVQS
jgi:hypothetical protein